MSCEAFSESSAQNTPLAVSEAKEWIEAVTEKKFKNGSIRESLEDGLLLCNLMNKIHPGFVKRINNSKSPIGYLDNIQQFLHGCQNMGLKNSQLFDIMDLQDIKGVKKTGVKRDEGDRRIRSVCITLYWLGRRVAELDDYDGPQLDLDNFKILMEENIPDADEVSVKETEIVLHGEVTEQDFLTSNQLENFQIQEETRFPIPSATSNGSMMESGLQENGPMLTFEQEQTADELLADIQNAVDEMLENFHLNPVPTPYQSAIPPQPIDLDTEGINSDNEVSVNNSACGDGNGNGVGGISKKCHTVKMLNRRKSGFGFQVMGGVDSSIPAQVDYVVPGSIAEDAGLEVGDILVCVNGQGVSDLSHVDLVGVIKQAGCAGEVVIRVDRVEASQNYQDGTSAGHAPQNNTSTPDATNFSHNESGEEWVEENEKMGQAQYQRNARSLDIEITNGPPPSYGRQSLPTLVEYHEEALFEEIEEMMEFASRSLSLEAISSSFLPLRKTYSEPPPTEHSSIMPIDLIQDDMESIEHELRELVLMENTEYPAQDYNLSDSASEEEGKISSKKVGTENAANTAAIKFNSFEVEESKSSLPLSHIHEIPIGIEIRQIEANSPREVPTQTSPHSDDIPVSCPPEIPSDEPVNELVKFAEDNWETVPIKTAPPVVGHSTQERVTRPRMINSPPPPKPKIKAPKRVVRRPAPPPPPPESGSEKTASPTNARNASTPVNDETIPVLDNGNENSLVQPSGNLEQVSNTQQACSSPQNVPNTPDHLTGQTHASTNQQDTPTPKHVPSPQGNVFIPKHASSPQGDVSSPKHAPTPQGNVFIPKHAPSSQGDVSSPKHVPSSQGDVSSPKHAPSSQGDVSSPKHVPSSQGDVSSPKHVPSLQPQEPVSSPHEATSPLQEPVSSPHEASSPLQDLFTMTPFQRSDSPDLVTQMKELAYSKIISTEFKPSTSMQEVYTTKKLKDGSPPGSSIQKDNYKLEAQHTQKEQQPQTPPFVSQNFDSIDSTIIPSDPEAVVAPLINMTLDPNTSDNVEIMGGIKIQRVQKSRWTPADSSPNHTSAMKKAANPVFLVHPGGSTTLPSSYLRSGMSKSINSSRSHEKSTRRDSVGASAVAARGIGRGISGGIRRTQEKKLPLGSQNSHQPHAFQKQYQQQPRRNQDEPRKQKLSPGNKAQKYAPTANGTSASRMQHSQSLSKGPIKDYKNNSSMTRSVTKETVKDGFQVAYAMTAKSSSDLCSHCHQPLGRGVVLLLPLLKVQYHTKCFICCVCRSPLGQEERNTMVLIKNKQLHCRRCASSDNGMSNMFW